MTVAAFDGMVRASSAKAAVLADKVFIVMGSLLC
jgi:hypothetical protein